jgi:hypothetical protein
VCILFEELLQVGVFLEVARLAETRGEEQGELGSATVRPLLRSGARRKQVGVGAAEERERERRENTAKGKRIQPRDRSKQKHP